jgi:hypothetical protein
MTLPGSQEPVEVPQQAAPVLTMLSGPLASLKAAFDE